MLPTRWCPSLSSTAHCGTPLARRRQAYLLASLAALGERIGGVIDADRRSRRRRGRPPSRDAGAHTRPRCRGLRAVRLAPRQRPSRHALRRVRHRVGAHRVVVRRPHPAGCCNQQGDGYQVFTPFARPWREHGWRQPLATPRSIALATLRSDANAGSQRPPDGLALPAAGEEAAAPALARLGRRAPHRLRRPARPARPRHDVSDVGAPQVGRDPPAHHARRHRDCRSRAQVRRHATATSSPGASSTPMCWPDTRPRRASTTARSSPRWSTTPPGEALRRLVRGADRVPDRRCRHAAAPRRGLDAQPGEDDHRGERPTSR